MAREVVADWRNFPCPPALWGEIVEVVVAGRAGDRSATDGRTDFVWLAPAPPLPLPSAPFFSAFVARSPAEEFPLPPLEEGYGGVVVLPRHRSAQRKRGREVAEQTLQLKNSFVDNFFYFLSAINKSFFLKF